MAMDPIAAKMIEDARASTRPNAHLLPVETARENFESDFGALAKPEVHSTHEVTVTARDGQSLRARLYLPSASPPAALTVFFHGGGWLLGSIDSHDVMARKIALASDIPVLSIDYRRGPEHKFPTAVNDAIDAVLQAAGVVAGLMPAPQAIAVAGDSAGGNLAGAVALHFIGSAEIPLKHQLLIYPLTTTDPEAGFNEEYEGIMLYRDELAWHRENYFAAPEDAADPRANLIAADPTGAVPATVVYAECDPIGLQSPMYAGWLREHGVDVEEHLTTGLIHGFFGLDELFPRAVPAMQFAGERLASALSGDSS